MQTRKDFPGRGDEMEALTQHGRSGGKPKPAGRLLWSVGVERPWELGRKGGQGPHCEGP